ncbi:hypothetical protein ACA910_003169 [Epithemia clementina (nom. ined.)]
MPRRDHSSEKASAPPRQSIFCSPKQSLDAYNEKVRGYTDWERDELMPALANRNYHLPGNGWCADWFQYFCNTHPVFGICCYHRLHPVKFPMRLLQLVGSIVFGLLVTNLIWLFLVYDETLDADRAIVTVSIGGGTNETDWLDSLSDRHSSNVTEDIETTTPTTVQVTEGMIFLWTVGGMIHAFHDNTIWFLTACVCCLPGRSMAALAGLKRYVFILLAFFVVAIAAISSFVVVVRATLSDNPDKSLYKSAGLVDDEIEPLTGFEDKSSFNFLLSYGVEILMALFVWYPLVGTLLFSGVLGCGRIPMLGGRPYEVLREQRRIERMEKQRQKQRPNA